MTDDDLLREASDPTTPGERLARLESEARALIDASDVSRYALALGLWGAVLGNPNCPLDVLRSGLIGRQMPQSCAVAAWLNPAVPALLLSEPRTEYREAVQEVRKDFRNHVALHPDGPMTIADFDRHLAGLFGLLWRE